MCGHQGVTLQNQKFSKTKTFNAKKKVYYTTSRAYSFTYVFNKQLLECAHVPDNHTGLWGHKDKQDVVTSTARNSQPGDLP